MAVCATVTEVLDGSHQTLEALFEEAGVPGPPPDLAHHSKWKTWLRRAGNDASVDGLAVIGRLIEEFMDLPPLPAAEILGIGIGHDPVAEYNQKRTRLNRGRCDLVTRRALGGEIGATRSSKEGFRGARSSRLLLRGTAWGRRTGVTT